MNINLTSPDCPQLHQLLQDYEAEFSPITGKQPAADGRYTLDVDLDNTTNYLCSQDNQPIGFCIKGETEGRHDILEFYIQPDMRGSKRGETLAHQVLRQHKGEWQVRQIEGADKAREFWHHCIHTFTQGIYNEEIHDDLYWGMVTRQTFTST